MQELQNNSNVWNNHASETSNDEDHGRAMVSNGATILIAEVAKRLVVNHSIIQRLQDCLYAAVQTQE